VKTLQGPRTLRTSDYLYHLWIVYTIVECGRI